MTSGFRLLMISAMYENGGNVVQRCLDGHPQMFVYPFESQLGTRRVHDRLVSMFPVKYRWPEFALDGTPESDYAEIIDEECKVRTRTPHVSKFRHVPFELSDAERAGHFARAVRAAGRSRANIVTAFFRATFESWRDFRRSGREEVHVGYSPIVVVDSDRILEDLPGARVLHVVRNPWSAYADTKRRPVPMSLSDYMLAWTTCQYSALIARARYPERVRILRAEDVMRDPVGTLGAVCGWLGLEPAASLATPSWNGTPLEEVYPWGTIRRPTPEANRATAEELSAGEQSDIRAHAWRYLEAFDYADFL